MATDHYGLSTLGPGDELSDAGYKYTDADRRYIDHLLYLGAEGHRHTGEAGSAVDAPPAPTLTLITAGGALPAGERFFYKVTIVDENGFESSPSAEVYLDTPNPIAVPTTPIITAYAVGGVLLPGVYYYLLTAYTATNTQETEGLYPAYITVPTGSSTNRVEIGFPTPPVGADGFNIYRKKPGGTDYDYLDSVTVAAAAAPYVDDGATLEDCNRTVPVDNATGADNGVLVTLDDILESGQTWRVYRTDVSGDFDNTRLYHVVEETSEGSGIITLEYEDVGTEVGVGSPPSASQSVGSPSKINLETEVTGLLPIANQASAPEPETVTFSHSGPLAVLTGSFVWVCESVATIVGVRSALGRGSTPAVSAVIVDVVKGTGADPTYSTIFTTPANRPTIPVGDQIGALATPNVTTLGVGDSLSVDIVQTGSGAIPTDVDLTVSIYLTIP